MKNNHRLARCLLASLALALAPFASGFATETGAFTLEAQGSQLDWVSTTNGARTNLTVSGATGLARLLGAH